MILEGELILSFHFLFFSFLFFSFLSCLFLVLLILFSWSSTLFTDATAREVIQLALDRMQEEGRTVTIPPGAQARLRIALGTHIPPSFLHDPRKKSFLFLNRRIISDGNEVRMARRDRLSF